jgi:hypothetical protein
MTSFPVFYTSYSTGESVADESPVNMLASEIVQTIPQVLRARSDFFGVIDSQDTTLQFMRGGGNRVWMEIPDPQKQGSYGRHLTMEMVLELMAQLPKSFELLKSHLTFQSWEPGVASESLYAIPAEQIKPLAEGHGACFATKMITVGDRGVGYMYREQPDSEADSGWRFFSGHESQDYVDNPDNTQIYDVNTIANYDPDIIPFLEAPPGTSYERDERGEFVQVQER